MLGSHLLSAGTIGMYHHHKFKHNGSRQPSALPRASLISPPRPSTQGSAPPHPPPFLIYVYDFCLHPPLYLHCHPEVSGGQPQLLARPGQALSSLCSPSATAQATRGAQSRGQGQKVRENWVPTAVSEGICRPTPNRAKHV